MIERCSIKVLREVFLHYCFLLIYKNQKVNRGIEIRNCNQRTEVEITHFHS